MKHKDLTIERVNNGFIVHESREPGVSGPKYVFNTPSATAVGIGNLLEHGTVDRPAPELPPFPMNMGATIHPDEHILKACISAGFGIPQNEFKARSTTAAEVRAEQERRGSFEQIIREEAKCHRPLFTNVDPQAWVIIQRQGPNVTKCPNPGVYRVAMGRSGGRPGSERHYLKVERDGSLHYGTRAPGLFKVDYQNGPAWDSWAQFLQSSRWTQFRLVRKPTRAHEAAWSDVSDFSRVPAGEYQVKNHSIPGLIRVLENGKVNFGVWADEGTQSIVWGYTPQWKNWTEFKKCSSWREIAPLPTL